MNTIKVRDKEFEVYLNESEIQKRIAEIGDEMNEEYANKNPLFIGILNGSFMFASDLMKAVNVPSEIAFIRMASYKGMESTGAVKQVLGLQENVFGRHLVLIEDIVDSGLTMDQVIKFFQERGPKSIRVATLLLKPEKLEKDLKLDYVGFEIPEKFVVGYGLDYNGHGRNLKDIYQLKGA
ncbi:hypoxanthine phosphoribosyltransferase [uncultured Roseivirga sp.]|uniref:hypoxanthine phosphoribosyltransferase n=1 Tax=uncultured Roseivirga sp. TaxID=543088 RepID=UPI0030D94C4D